MQHHRHTGSDISDPEKQFYGLLGYTFSRMHFTQFLKGVLSDMMLWRSFQKKKAFGEVMSRLKQSKKTVTWGEKWSALIFWGVVLSTVTYLGIWKHFLVFWVLPLVFVTPVLFQLHNYAEHTGAEGPSEFERTWSCHFHPFVQMFIQPLRSGLHLEHHLYPSVPWYRLKKLHRRLCEDPLFSKRALKIRHFFFGPKSILRALVIGKGTFREDSLEGWNEND